MIYLCVVISAKIEAEHSDTRGLKLSKSVNAKKEDRP